MTGWMDTGIVKQWDEKKGIGAIARPGKEDAYFEDRDTFWGWRPRKGDEVAFEAVRERKGPRARNVIRVERRRKCTRA